MKASVASLGSRNQSLDIGWSADRKSPGTNWTANGDRQLVIGVRLGSRQDLPSFWVISAHGLS